jgi:hypothetical protein
VTQAPGITVAEGPWFEDFEPGLRVEHAPSVTLNSGQAALHQAIGYKFES